MKMRYICVYMYVCMCVYMYVYIYIYILCVCVCVYSYTLFYNIWKGWILSSFLLNNAIVYLEYTQCLKFELLPFGKKSSEKPC